MTYYNKPIITDWQWQILLGSILGGSTLIKPKNAKNCYLTIRSSNKDWLEYKKEELKQFAAENNNELNLWRSYSCPSFSEIYKLFYYKGQRIIKMECLDQLKDIGLAIWFGDKGSVINEKVNISTTIFGLEGTNIISRFFNEININNVIYSNERGIKIVMDESGSNKFLMIISEKLPDFMHKKLIGEEIWKK